MLFIRSNFQKTNKQNNSVKNTWRGGSIECEKFRLISLTLFWLCFWLVNFSRLLHYSAYVIVFRDDVINFYSNLGNYSFVCVYWTAYCLRIHYRSFKSYWTVLSKYQKAMGSLLFIFCWRKHIFLMAIQK